MEAKKNENTTYVQSSPFNLHGLQDLLYCTFVDEITQGLPSTLICSFVCKLSAESSSWTTICCRDDRVLVFLGFGAAKYG